MKGALESGKSRNPFPILPEAGYATSGHLQTYVNPGVPASMLILPYSDTGLV